METLQLLWSFAPDIKLKLLLLALAAQMYLALRMYLKLSANRVAAAKAGRVDPKIYKATENEPEELRVFTRAVANQFEMPVLFYAIIIAGIAASTSTWLTVVLAWAFVALRFVHAGEMTTSNNVFRRRKMFIRSTQVFLVMLVEFVIATLFLAQA